MREKIWATVLENTEHNGIFSMWLQAENFHAKPGQFINMYLTSESKILPRPISVCETCEGKIRVVFQVAGGGTKILSEYGAGEKISILGGLGNGFAIQKADSYALVGGGIGIPPLIQLAKELRAENPDASITAYLGGRTTGFLEYLGADFQKTGARAVYATDDGSLGYKGNVVSLLEQADEKYDLLYSCGPRIMLKALAGFANERNIPAQVSMEERMACGIGACVGCVVKIKSEAGASYKKVCKDGPVFMASEVAWDE